MSPDGSLHVTNGVNQKRIRRISPSGIITTFFQWQSDILELFVDLHGTLYFADTFVSYRIDALGVAVPIVSSLTGPPSTNAPEGTAAQGTRIGLQGFSVDPDGVVYAGDSFARKLWRVEPGLPGFGAGSWLIPSDDSRELFVFDGVGRQQATISALTSAVMTSFVYGVNGFISQVSDANGNVTTVERDASGRPTAIVGPFGQRTELELDANGRLAVVRYPTGEEIEASYSEFGLLASLTDGRGETTSWTYDDAGRLAREDDAAGGFKTLNFSALPDGWNVAMSTALGRTTNYEVRQLATGATSYSGLLPDGTQSSNVLGEDGVSIAMLANGERITASQGPDPRFWLGSPLTSETTVLPSGLTRVETVTRTAVLSQPLAPLSLESQTDSRSINGKVWSSTFVKSTRTTTKRSPEGKTTSTVLDEFERPSRLERAGILPVEFEYDARGRLAVVRQGPRISRRTYYETNDSRNGYLQNVTNAALETVAMTPDARGRHVLEVYADSNQTAFSWDANNNLVSLIPPGRPAHAHSYNPLNTLESYTPPILPDVPTPGSTFTYDADGLPRLTTRPDGLVLERLYDAGGRLEAITTPNGNYDYQYFGIAPCMGCASGKLSRVTSPQGVALDFTYNGPLVTRSTWSGTTSGALSMTYDNNFRVATDTVSAGPANSTIRYGYDGDGLRICASPTTCSPAGSDALRAVMDPEIARVAQVVLGATTEAHSYNNFGELANLTSRHGSTVLYSEVMDSATAPRDALGRITTRVEMTATGVATWQYAFDVRGRLQEVFKNSASVERFTYDASGNRNSRIAPTATWTGVYDDQDRLRSYGPFTYNYTANGELRSKTNAGQTTTYTHDVRGNLVRVDLPNATIIEYVVDGQNRRVGKKRNGVLERQWIYKDHLRISAELDGAGALVSRFVYVTRDNVPDLVIRGGATYRVFSDHLGSPRVAVNVANANDIPLNLEYDAFGTVSGVGAGWIPQGFAGGLHDTEIGLVRFGARDYDPTIGRWITKDPVRFHGGLNLYVYSHGDPVNYIDTTGRVPVVAALGFAAAVMLATSPEAVAAIVAVAPQTGLAALLSSILTLDLASDTVCPIRGESRELDRIAKDLGIPREALRKALEKIKKANGLRGNENVDILPDGTVVDRTSGDPIGNVVDEQGD